MSLYESIPKLLPDPILGVAAAYRADTRSDKLTLVTGYFRDRQLNVPLLKVVSVIEEEISMKKHRREYLPIIGDIEYIHLIGELVFGELYRGGLACSGFQTVGGTGALCLCGKLIEQFVKGIAISNYTWVNHWNIFREAGLEVVSYPYYRDKQLQFDEMIATFAEYPEGMALLLHACSHNPTGLDLSRDQWREIAEVVKKRHLYPVIDMAYQGFSIGPNEDAFGPRLFFEEGIEFALTYTCSKNFSIYGERAGALFFVVHDKKQRENVESQVKVMVRQMYSEPPFHASAIVKGVLGDPKLKSLWFEELVDMRKRTVQAREDFVSMISAKDPDGGWETLREGTGLFCVTELSDEALARLRTERGIYVIAGGRINLTGFNMDNLERVIDAILDVK